MRLPLIILLALLPLLAHAQPGGSTTRGAHRAVVPPGFQRIEIEGRIFFLERADEPLVRSALEQATPTTIPTTMPADLLERLQDRKAQLAQTLAGQLGVADAQQIQAHLETNLVPLLDRLDALRPPIIYIVATPEALKQAMRDGWSDPRFHYNRAADAIEMNFTLNLSLDEDGDDVLVPVVYDASASQEQRELRVQSEVRTLESNVLENVSLRAQQSLLEGLVDAINDQALAPLKLKRDQEWLAVGVAGTLAAIHGADIIGLDATRSLDAIASVNPRNRVRPQSIDLLKPADPKDLQPQWVPAYMDAFRSRAVTAVRTLIDEAGAEAIGKVLLAIRANPPADGAALVTLIQQTTGVDLTAHLQAR